MTGDWHLEQTVWLGTLYERVFHFLRRAFMRDMILTPSQQG